MSSDASEIVVKTCKEDINLMELPQHSAVKQDINSSKEQDGHVHGRMEVEQPMSSRNSLAATLKGDQIHIGLRQSNAVGDGYWPGSQGGKTSYVGAKAEEFNPSTSASPSFYHQMPYNAMGEPYSTQSTNMSVSYAQTAPLHGMPVINNVAITGNLGGYAPVQDNSTQNRLVAPHQTRNAVMPSMISNQRQRNPQWDRMGGWGGSSNGWRSGNVSSPVSPGWTMSQPTAMVQVNPVGHHTMFSPPKSPLYSQGQNNLTPSPNPPNFYGGNPSNNYRSQYTNLNGSAKSHSRMDAGYQVQPSQEFQSGGITGLSNQFMNMMRPNQDPMFNAQRGYPKNGGGVGMMNGGMIGPFGQRSDRAEIYSRKVFVGGLPPDIDEEEITASFSNFGMVTVDWPHKAESRSYFPPKGYCFLLFHEEASVQTLVEACTQREGKLYWHVSSPTMKDKAVQIRPWSLSDCDYYVNDSSLALDPRRTIFVGGVPRPLRAAELAAILDNLYGGVCYAGIDTDPELKYPKGAGRVSFSNQPSYIAAINARFVQLQHGDIDKRVEVKPYVLDDQVCDECRGDRCGGKSAPFFCANVACLQYYCDHCWGVIHMRPGREYHKPLVKDGASDRPRGVPYRWY